MPRWIACFAPVLLAAAVLAVSAPPVLAGNEGDTNEEARTGSTQDTPLLRAIVEWEREKYNALQAVDPKLRRVQAYIMDGDAGSAMEAAARESVPLAAMRLIVKYDPIRVRHKSAEVAAQAIVARMILKDQPAKALVTAMAFGLALSITPESTLDVATGAVFGKVAKAAKAYSAMAGKVAAKAEVAVAAAINAHALSKAVAAQVQQDLAEAHQEAAQAESQ